MKSRDSLDSRASDYETYVINGVSKPTIGKPCDSEPWQLRLESRAAQRRRNHPNPDGPQQLIVAGLARIEGYVRRKPMLVQTVRTLRAVTYYLRQRISRNSSGPIATKESSPRSHLLIRQPAIAELLTDLNVKAFNAGLMLRPAVVNRLQSILPSLSEGIHTDVDARFEVIDEIVSDPFLLEVVRQFLRSEPVLIECKIGYGAVFDGDTLSAGFHFDHAGHPSLNVMAYITDIDEMTAPHVVIEGSHASKTWSDFLRERLPMEEAKRRFPGRIRYITGPAGTVILENTEAFHTRVAGHKRRAILNILFSTRSKRLLSHAVTERRRLQASRKTASHASTTNGL